MCFWTDLYTMFFPEEVPGFFQVSKMSMILTVSAPLFLFTGVKSFKDKVSIALTSHRNWYRSFEKLIIRGQVRSRWFFDVIPKEKMYSFHGRCCTTTSQEASLDAPPDCETPCTTNNKPLILNGPLGLLCVQINFYRIIEFRGLIPFYSRYYQRHPSTFETLLRDCSIFSMEFKILPP